MTPPPLLSPPITAHPEPGRPAAGTLGPEGRHCDGGQVRHLCGAAIWSHDRQLHLLGSGQPIRVQEVSKMNIQKTNKQTEKNPWQGGVSTMLSQEYSFHVLYKEEKINSQLNNQNKINK